MSTTRSDSDAPIAVTYDPFAAGELETVVRATEAQQEIWASVRMGGRDANLAYNEAEIMRVAADVEEQTLRRALAALVERHEALRAVFSADGTWLCVRADSVVDLQVHDCSGLDAGARASAVQAAMDRAVETPFDLEAGPLLRTELLKLGTSSSVVVLAAHHIVCDGWSIDVLVRDLGILYGAFARGMPPALPPADRFSDYAVRLERHAQSTEAAATEAAWLKRFEGDLPVLELPVDHKRSPVRTYRGRLATHALDVELTRRLRRVGTDRGVTLVTVFLAAFKVLLYRLSGQTDLIVGVPAAGQSATGMEFLVGHCVNLLPLRSQLVTDMPFNVYLQTVSTTLLDAHDRQLFTFGTLVKTLKPRRAGSRVPLLPAAFNIDQGINVDVLRFGGEQTETESVPRHYENFELFLNLEPAGDTFVLQAYHNADIFNEGTVASWLAMYQRVLTAITVRPESPVGELPLLPDAERDRILREWGMVATNYPRSSGVHELFAELAGQHPDRVAAVEAAAGGPGETDAFLSYGELNARANRLACRLGALGVRPGTPVGLCCERSLDMLVALLGILKAGGAYVPLDPAYPEERVAFMLRDTGIGLVVTNVAGRERLPAFAGRYVCLDADAETIAACPADNPPARGGGDALAYIMYTSGSTGQPKGACIPHRGVVRLVRNTNFMTLDADTVMLHFAPIAFDAATLEVWGPLLNGGQVVVYPPATPTVQELGAVIRGHGINTLWLPAELFRLVVDECLDDLAGVSQLLAGGDVLPVAQVRRVLDELPTCRMINGYGPTENTTFTCCYEIPRDEDIGAGVPIGRPVANTSVYILDTHVQPVPIGVPGELYTGGDGLALGYWQRSELTAAAFVADPFSDRPGARLYRTGDRVRMRADGVIEFLGRMDRQVKIRGYRVEPTEIEIALAQHPRVAQAAVTVERGPAGEACLAAYFTPAPGKAVGLNSLRRHLRECLPIYMVPTTFVELNELPLTPTGKLDRKRLPSAAIASPAEPPVEPRTDAERAVAAVWCELLGLKRVSPDANFFDIGGHSLLAIRAAARIRERMGVELKPNAMLFNTLAQVAAQCASVPIPEPDAQAEAAPRRRLGRRHKT